jgi:hypothetical protein
MGGGELGRHGLRSKLELRGLARQEHVDDIIPGDIAWHADRGTCRGVTS